MFTWARRKRLDDQLVIRATDYLVKYLAAHPSATPVQVAAFMSELTTQFGRQTAASAYQALRTSRETHRLWDVLPRPGVAAPATTEQVVASTAWALQTRSGIDLTPEQTRKRLSGVLGRMVLQPGRDTVWSATVRAGTAWARIPGGHACDFCLMLASRGAVYHSRKRALEASGTRGPRSAPDFHDRCNCIAVESYSDADLPEVVHSLNAEWYEVTWEDGRPKPNQAAAWREHIEATRPDRTTLRTP